MPAQDPEPKKRGDYKSAWPEIAKADEPIKKISVSPNVTPLMPQQKLPAARFFVAMFMVGGFIVLGLLAFLLFGQNNNPSVTLEFSKPDRIFVGEPFDVTVSYTNNSDKVLADATISMLLPDGVLLFGDTAGQRLSEESLGDLGPGSLNKHAFRLVVPGKSQSQTRKNLKAELSYTDNGRRYARELSVDILVGPPAVTLSLNAPKQVLSGDMFDVTLTYQNNTSQVANNLKLRTTYAPIYKFSKSSLDSGKQSDTEWNLESLNPGESKTLTITGSAIGQEQTFFGFGAALFAHTLGQEYEVDSQNESLAISAAPLSLIISYDDEENDVAYIGEGINYTLHYKNNSSVIFQNVTIRAQLIGELYDFASPQTNANFNSVTNTFTWLTANTPELAQLLPGQQGSVTLGLRLKDAFPIRRLSDKNYTVKINAQIESPTVLPDTSLSRTISLSNLELKVAGILTVDALGFWRDAASGILNSGPFPPKANQATQYTVHWRIKNYATDVGDVKVSAFLQSGARCTGTFKSNWTSQPSCDPNSGLVTWQVGSIPATKGIIGDPVEGIFQIELTPPFTAVGDEVDFLGETKIEGRDLFAGISLANGDAPLSTGLPDDPTLSVSGAVQP